MRFYVHLSGVLWLIWLVTWFAAAIWSDRAAKTAGTSAEAPYRILTWAGAILMFWSGDRPTAWITPPWLAWVGLALEAGGFAFCWWARIHLGRLWSATVGAKAEHRVIDTGPYGLVRHPIYTGLFSAVIGAVIIEGRWQAMAGAALIFIGTWLKARLEERFLRETLGAEAYDEYAARTSMLIPGLKPPKR